MDWYYAVGNEQKGPITDAEFQLLVQGGVVTPQTLVWREGLANWLPHGQVSGAAVGAGAAQTGRAEVVCSQCGKIFPQDEVIRYGDASVCAACKPAFVQRLKEGAALGGAMEYGGFWIRFGAKFIDNLILMVPVMVVFFLVIASAARQRNEAVMVLAQIGIQVVFYLLAILYNTFFIGRFGATPGKMACKLKVVTPEGGEVTYGRAFGRAFAEILSGIICNIGYIIAAFDDEKRALHDRICNTRVVKR